MRSLRPSKQDNNSKLIPKDISESLGKLPPQACDLEEAVLGAILLEKDAINHALASSLVREHFYTEAHAIIYDACLDLFRSSLPINILTVKEWLKKIGKYELIPEGGAYYIAQLTSRVSSAANLDYHIRIVQEKFMKRELIKMANQIYQHGYSETDIFDNIEEIQKMLFAMDLGRGSQKPILDSFTLYTNTVRALQTKISHNGLTGVASGFRPLDAITSGWQRSNLIIIAARPAMGKALSMNEDILTDKGWIKMRDVKIGMNVASSDGEFYPVTGVYPQGIRKVYEVHFDDRTIIKCDEEHLWKIQTRKDRKCSKFKDTVMSLKEMIKGGIVLSGNRKNYSIEFCSPIQKDEEPHYIHPYVIGVLIGDGGITGTCVRFHNSEEDVVDNVRKLVPNGYTISSNGISHHIKAEVNIKENRVMGELKRLRLNAHSYDKHIPTEYLYDSIENRIQLLRGLMDTDGSVPLARRVFIEYSTSSQNLSKDICILVRSLGGKAVLSIRKSYYKKDGIKKECRLNYRILITFNGKIIPFSSKKHLLRYNSAKRFFKKFVREVKYSGEEEVQCISVDSPDNTFLTNNYTITHNTAFTMTLAREAARNIPVAVFSLEMASQELMERLISSENKIPNDKLRSGVLTSLDWEIINRDQGKLSASKLFIDDTAAISIYELRSKCMRLKHEQDIQMVLIDYLQLMRGDREGNREQEISSISRGLKALSKELNIPVIALSQLSRSVETRGGDKRPQLSDLRESGSIEQDSDLVLFLYRPEYYNVTVDEDGMPTQGVCEVIVAKHRGGGTGMVKVKFEKYFTKFTDWDSIQAPPIHAPELRPLPTSYKDRQVESRNENEKSNDDLPF